MVAYFYFCHTTYPLLPQQAAFANECARLFIDQRLQSQPLVTVTIKRSLNNKLSHLGRRHSRKCGVFRSYGIAAIFQPGNSIICCDEAGNKPAAFKLISVVHSLKIVIGG